MDAKIRELLNVPNQTIWVCSSLNNVPHVVPVWFVLRDNKIVFFSDKSSKKVRNLRFNPQVALHLPSAEAAEVVILSGLASLPADRATRDSIGDDFWSKYRGAMLVDGWTEDMILSGYTQPVEVEITKVQSW